MEYFYDFQIKRYLTQFMRLMSNFSYKDGQGNLVQIPVRYGDMNRQVGQILKKNSENVVQSAPFIACYIKAMEYDRNRLADPTYVSKFNIRERAYDEHGQEYLNVQGANYTIERIMPTPFNLKFNADIWTTNTDQKLQILEQLLVLFNPSMEIQSSNNFLDWTSLSLVELTDMTFSSRQIPQGVEQDIDIATLNFTTPIWITPPAKVKKLGIITKIISSIFDEPPGTAAGLQPIVDGQTMDFFAGNNPISIQGTTLGDLGLLVLDNTDKLVSPKSSRTNLNSDPISVPSVLGPIVNWNSILDQYPGVFTAGLSQIRLMKPDGNEIVGRITLNPTDETVMQVTWDSDTIPMNTLLTDRNDLNPRGTIDAIINPQTYDPRPIQENGSLGWPTTDTRYLLLEDLNSEVAAWQNQDNSYFTANANDIVQWDGTKWNTIFTSAINQGPTYITNSRTGVQYMWNGESWMKSYEGVYEAIQWRLVL